MPPAIFEGDRVLQVKEKTMLTVDCQANGIPAPQISWKRDGVPVDTVEGSRLVIKSPKANDAGR